MGEFSIVKNIKRNNVNFNGVNHTINNLFIYICIKMVPLSFEKSNQILKELMKFKKLDK